MTNSIRTPQVFNHPQFGEIRTITINNQPWFVGKDVESVLDCNNPYKTIIAHISTEGCHPLIDERLYIKTQRRRDFFFF